MERLTVPMLNQDTRRSRRGIFQRHKGSDENMALLLVERVDLGQEMGHALGRLELASTERSPSPDCRKAADRVSDAVAGEVGMLGADEGTRSDDGRRAASTSVSASPSKAYLPSTSR